jgi:F-type H+-transporting ATPase subunit epsilon
VSIDLSILTPERTLVEQPVDSLVAPGTEGEFGVLPGHEPFMAPLRPGELHYEANGDTVWFAVSGGFVEVTDARITVLARTAEPRDEIDMERAQAAHARALEKLSQVAAETRPDEVERLKERLARAEARLRVTQQ